MGAYHKVHEKNEGKYLMVKLCNFVVINDIRPFT